MQRKRTDIYLFDQRDDLEPLVRQKLNENFRRVMDVAAVEGRQDNAILSQRIDEVAAEGTRDYNELDNKPKIESVTLQGDKSFPELGIFIDPDEQYPRSDDYAIENTEITDMWNLIMNS